MVRPNILNVSDRTSPRGGTLAAVVARGDILGRRALARLIDQFLFYFALPLLLLSLTVGALQVTGQMPQADADDPDSLAMGWTFAAFIFSWPAIAIAEIILVARTGCTPGKWLSGIKIIRIGGTRPPGLGRSVVRFGMMWLTLPIVVLVDMVDGPLTMGQLGLLATPVIVGWAFVDRGGRGLHDRASNMTVTRRGKRA